MNTLLRYAQREVDRLKRKKDTSDIGILDLVLVFNRSEEEMESLTGYPAFAEALKQLGGKHTEANIQQACRMSMFSRESVFFDDMYNGEEMEDIHIPLICTRKQMQKMVHGTRYTLHTHFSLD